MKFFTLGGREYFIDEQPMRLRQSGVQAERELGTCPMSPSSLIVAELVVIAQNVGHQVIVSSVSVGPLGL